MKVYVSPNDQAKTYHFSHSETNKGLQLDDDCPIAEQMIQGEIPHVVMDEEQAQQMGYRACQFCSQEYLEDKTDKALQFTAIGIAIIGLFITWITS